MNDADAANFDIKAFRRNLLTTDPLVKDIHVSKYRWNRPDGTSDEKTVDDTRTRVVAAVYYNDPSSQAYEEALNAVRNGYLIPAGRVNAGAGTGRAVTLLNCFVQDTIQDSLQGIQWSISRGAFTMQQGGGIGSDFSTIRPAGAIVRRTGSVSSGVIPFMDEQDAMCTTVISAGTRRGAMMGCLADWHADLYNPRQYETSTHPATGEPILTHPSFISAKRQKGRLNGFNVSVLVSDKFLEAVRLGLDWDLGHFVPRADGVHVDVYDRPFPYDEVELDSEFRPIPSDYWRRKGDMHPWYVYTRVQARVIWNSIMESTYKYAEPGVIYIDRVNNRNNLNYVEYISATNPCAEQPLPPDGCCCLASVNLAFMVNNPFTPQASFDFQLLERTAKIGVRFLDNVLDVTNYPLEAQRVESMNKRRIGLGITGFADALIQLGVKYGDADSVVLARRMALRLKLASYAASMELARERGAFLLCDVDEFLVGYNIMRDLPENLRADIRKHGIRNGVINTIAPNGTISIYTGNLSSGHEPVFSFKPVTRKVRQPDGSALDYESVPYSLRLWNAVCASGGGWSGPLPDYFVGAMDVSVEDHVRVHAAWQEYIDSSCSKTVNCPTEMSFEDFKGVYDLAYELGCKGCTTYRYDPDSGRGSVLSVDAPGTPTEEDVEGLAQVIENYMTADDRPRPLSTLEYPQTPYSDDVVEHAAVEMFARHNDMSFDTALLRIDQVPGTVAHWKAVAAHSLNKVGERLTLEVMNLISSATPQVQRPVVEVMPAQRVVEGRRYKLTWRGENWYVNITRVGNVPFEVFITTKAAHHSEWVQTLSRLLTAVLRRGGDIRFLINELGEIHSANGGAFIADQKRFRPSIVAAIGGVLEEEFKLLGIMDVQSTTQVAAEPSVVPVTVTYGTGPDSCPSCGATPLVHEQGCLRCLYCFWTKC